MKIVLLVALTASCNCFATDLGTFGKVFPINEENMVSFIKSKMQEKKDNGEVAKFYKDFTDRSKSYAQRPPGITLPRAVEDKVVLFDPTITIQEDIVTADGQVLYLAGTKVNPLDYKALTKSLCFIDADDIEQVAWLEKTCPDNISSKSILVNGNVIKLMEQLDRQIYFDQKHSLVEHFGITALPTIIRQEGRFLNVKEIKLN